VPIRLETAGPVARVTIDRPAVANALDGAAADELRKLWPRLDADPAIRVIVLTGAGDRAFCAGADLGEGVDCTELNGPDYLDELTPGGFAGLPLNENLMTPVIGRINGHALGGGLALVLGCDIAVAVEGTVFGFPEPRVGQLPLDGGMQLLPRQIPYRVAMGMLLTGRRVPASEAAEIGLVNECVEREKLDETVQRWCDDILACAPLALRAIKASVRRTAHLEAAAAARTLLDPTAVDWATGGE